MPTNSTRYDVEMLRVDNLRQQRFTGEVVDANDPLRQYRCKIRVRGKFDELDTEDIPWSIPATNSFYAGEGGAGVSYPKEGTEVVVTFFDGDLYSPIYHHPIELENSMLQAIQNSYENSAVIHWDSDEGLEIYYTQDNGFIINQRESFLNFLENGNVLLQHTGNQSSIELAEGDITITSNNRTDISSPNEITINSNLVHANGLRTELGANPIFSNVNGEPLMIALKALASAIDSKAPQTPGVTAQLIQQLEPLILSTTVKTTS